MSAPSRLLATGQARSEDADRHDPVNHPSHYTSHPSGIECIDVTRLLGFDLGNTVKYVWRRGDKGNPAQDLDKSLFYFDDAVAHQLTGMPDRQRRTGPLGRLVGALERLRRPQTATPTLHTPPAAAELLLCVADHDPDPVAADFYRAVAAMDWDSARAAVLQLRTALPGQ